MISLKFVTPLLLFLIIGFFLLIGLKLDPREVPSPLIGKNAPELNLPALFDERLRVRLSDLKGQIWILNVWASWCVSCQAEHSLFNQLADKNLVTLVGLNYKDDSQNAKDWLKKLGNPYDFIAVDQDGAVGINWGVYGVPETFIIDKNGLIRYKHIGPLDKKILIEKIMPLINDLDG